MKTNQLSLNKLLAAACVLFMLSAAVQGSGYDPLALPGKAKIDQFDSVVKDSKRQRDIPILIYLPKISDPAPVVLFSHGLGGSRKGSSYLGRHWAGRGYAAVFLQHPGSDTSVWKEKPVAGRMQAMRQAANASNFILRVRDVPAVLNKLEEWNRTKGHVLAGRLIMEKVGMSGHSFGAVTTQAVSGQRSMLKKAMFTDKRIAAALVMSPSSPRRGSPERAFGGVSLPWMLMTGTKDTAPIGNTDVASRLAVFPALPPGGKYELVLYGAEHSAFTDHALPGDIGARNPNHHRVVLALSTAFWDAYLKNNSNAKEWLEGNGPKSVLEKRDSWKIK